MFSPSAAPRAEIQDAWAWVQSGLNTDGCHNPMTRRRIQRGDIVMLNAFPESLQVLGLETRVTLYT